MKPLLCVLTGAARDRQRFRKNSKANTDVRDFGAGSWGSAVLDRAVPPPCRGPSHHVALDRVLWTLLPRPAVEGRQLDLLRQADQVWRAKRDRRCHVLGALKLASETKAPYRPAMSAAYPVALSKSEEEASV